MSLEKEFVSYEQAVALKELAFGEKCIATVENNGYVHIKGTRGLPSAAAVVNKVDAPLKQQVFKWFREKYDFLVIIRDIEIIASDKSGYRWKWIIFRLTEDIYIAEDKSLLGSLTYEEAENACIDKLIELAKQQEI